MGEMLWRRQVWIVADWWARLKFPLSAEINVRTKLKQPQIANGRRSEEDQVGFTRPWGLCSRPGMYGHVCLLWRSEARRRHDQSHPPCHWLRSHLPRYLWHLRSLHQRNSSWQGTPLTLTLLIITLNLYQLRFGFVWAVKLDELMMNWIGFCSLLFQSLSF